MTNTNDFFEPLDNAKEAKNDMAMMADDTGYDYCPYCFSERRYALIGTFAHVCLSCGFTEEASSIYVFNLVRKYKKEKQ